MTNLEKRFPGIEQMRESWGSAYEDFLDELAAVPRAHGKPLFVTSFIAAGGPSLRTLIEGDVPVFPSASRAARAMRALLDYRLIRDDMTR